MTFLHKGADAKKWRGVIFSQAERLIRAPCNLFMDTNRSCQAPIVADGRDPTFGRPGVVEPFDPMIAPVAVVRMLQDGTGHPSSQPPLKVRDLITRRAVLPQCDGHGLSTILLPSDRRDLDVVRVVKNMQGWWRVAQDRAALLRCRPIRHERPRGAAQRQPGDLLEARGVLSFFNSVALLFCGMAAFRGPSIFWDAETRSLDLNGAARSSRRPGRTLHGRRRRLRARGLEVIQVHWLNHPCSLA